MKNSQKKHFVSTEKIYSMNALTSLLNHLISSGRCAYPASFTHEECETSNYKFELERNVENAPKVIYALTVTNNHDQKEKSIPINKIDMASAIAQGHPLIPILLAKTGQTALALEATNGKFEQSNVIEALTIETVSLLVLSQANGGEVDYLLRLRKRGQKTVEATVSRMAVETAERRGGLILGFALAENMTLAAQFVEAVDEFDPHARSAFTSDKERIEFEMMSSNGWTSNAPKQKPM